MRYLGRTPVAWRAVAVAQALGGALFAPLLAPLAAWFAFPRSRFVRAHALSAALAQGLGLLLVGLMKIPSLLFIIEEEQYFATIEEIFGALFAGMPPVAGLVLLLSVGLGVLTLVMLAAPLSSGLDNSGRRRMRVQAGEVVRAAVIAALATPLLFYNQFLWGGAGPLAEPDPLGLDNQRFLNDPYAVFPGHAVLVWCALHAILALRGKTALLWPASRLFVQLHRDQRLRGEARFRAARRRALLLPGWGMFYSGARVSGLATFCLAALLALFGFFSLCLHYGALVEGGAGLNANLPWQFLASLGLRGHQFSDGQLKDIFGSTAALLILSALMLCAYIYSLVAVYWMHHRPQGGRFFAYAGVSALVHAAPAAILVFIPITVLSPPPSSAPEPLEVEFSLPYLVSEDLAENNGAVASGEEGAAEQIELAPSPALAGQALPGDEPGPRGEERARERVTDAREARERSESEESRLKGERLKQTYSNYISHKIRAGERSVKYWSQTPNPYAVVVEYRVSAQGRVSEIRLRERSQDAQADQLTVELVQAMGDLLPPPGGGAVQVTELFWNTRPGDPNLPTPLMRALAKEFDGRVIEPLQ